MTTDPIVPITAMQLEAVEQRLQVIREARLRIVKEKKLAEERAEHTEGMKQAEQLRKKVASLAKLLTQLDKKMDTINRCVANIQALRLALGDREFYYLKEEHEERHRVSLNQHNEDDDNGT